MSQIAVSESREVLRELLVKLHQRLNGVLDMGTVLCLGSGATMLNPSDFIARQTEILRSLTVVIDSLVPGAEPSSALTRELVRNSRELERAFALLAHFKTAPAEDIRTATDVLVATYRRMSQLLAQLSETLNGVGPPWYHRTAEQEAYYEGILHRLYDLFMQARQENHNQPVGEVSCSSAETP